ncbi:MAG: UDP-N-acetylmuramoyl-L-alanine--D-glutamate ligase [Candidatus Peregrinibacteria bacterium]
MIDTTKTYGIFGWGVEGKSVYRWLTKHGAQNILVFDENPVTPEGTINRPPTADFSKIAECDILFRSPGVRPEKCWSRAVSCNGSTSATKYFFHHSPTKNIVGVTGTKGKGTTSTLIYEILKNAGKQVFLGGNIGTPVFDFFDELTPESWVVLELSSFQLFDLDISPPYAVLLRTDSEHLDWHTSVKEYREAKQNLFQFQKKEDTLVVFGESDITKKMAEISPAKKIWVRPNGATGEENEITAQNGFVETRFIASDKTRSHETIFPISSIQLRGKFQYENVLAATAIAKEIGIPNKTIQKTVENFKGLPMRCELVAEKNGIQFFNDSFSTIPETTIASLSTFTSPVLLILGGSEKYSDFTELARTCAQHPSLHKIFLIGKTAPRILEALQRAESRVSTEIILEEDENEQKGHGEKVLQKIFQSVETNNNFSLLLSPACASFGLFTNYKERGEIFNTLAKAFPED